MRNITYLIAIAMLTIFSSGARTAEFGSRDEAVAMVKRAQKIYREQGAETLFKAVNKGDRRFRDRDLYVYIGHRINDAGLMVAHGAKPELVGKNLIDLKDQNGKFLVQEMIELLDTRNSGWVDYRWANPEKSTIEDKTAYLERMGPYFVGVGVYRPEQTNENTVSIISGNPDSAATYLQIACELSAVLNDGDNLRIVPVVGMGGVQNIRDVRTLKGIDIGFTQSNILNSYRRTNREQVGSVEENNIVYIANLFNEEAHLIARKDITSIKQLRGQKVNIDEVGSGTAFTMRDIFKKLGIKIEEVNIGQADALEKIKQGEIAATVLIAGKPAPSLAPLKLTDGFRLLPILYDSVLIEDYLPARLTAQDYPGLIEPDQIVNTVAVSAVLIAYNWPTSSDRYRRVKKFVEALFAKIDEFQKPPRHAKWREVNLASTLPGWDRFEPAQEQLKKGLAGLGLKQVGFNQFLADKGRSRNPMTAAQREELFKQFIKWQETR